MQFIKTLILRVSLLAMTLMMLFVGLGVAAFAAVVLLLARLFVSPKSHEVLQTKWAERQARYKNGQIIDGQYTVLDSH